MTQPAEHVSWWIIPVPGLLLSALMFLTMWIISRKRRWRDRSVLGKATAMPLEMVAIEPKTVRDMVAGQEAYVASHAIVTSQRGRKTFVRWDERLAEKPKDPQYLFAPLPIRRLERGFSLTVRSGDQFRTGSLPWGWYAPVIEIIQAAPVALSEKQRNF